MNTTIITGHPYSHSFNHALVAQVKAKTNATVINLIADQFNPTMLSEDLAGFARGYSPDPLVKKYQKILAETHQLIIIAPIWWYGLPAIYKGFIDKVMLKGFAYTEKKGRLVGKLDQISKTILITTSQAPKWYLKYFAGNPIKWLRKRVLKDLGLTNVKWYHQGKITNTTLKDRQKFLELVASKVTP